MFIHKNKILTFVTFLVLGLATQTKAQNVLTDTIRWKATGFHDLAANVAVDQPCDFIIYNGSKIEWVQKGGSVIYTIVVSSTDGSWANINQDGVVEFRVAFDGLVGTIKFSRNGQSMNIIMDVHGNGDSNNDIIKNEYSISNIEIL